jgi:hypothetical protein
MSKSLQIRLLNKMLIDEGRVGMDSFCRFEHYLWYADGDMAALASS